MRFKSWLAGRWTTYVAKTAANDYLKRLTDPGSEPDENQTTNDDTPKCPLCSYSRSFEFCSHAFHAPETRTETCTDAATMADPQVCATCGCSCSHCRHSGGGDDHTRECKDRFWREQDASPCRAISPTFKINSLLSAASMNSDGPLIAPRPAPIADNRDAVARAMCALGSAYRGDWSTFDGRTLKLSMEDLSAHLHDSADPVTYEKLCADEGVCPVERCWTEYCSKSQHHTCEHLASLISQRTESTS